MSPQDDGAAIRALRPDEEGLLARATLGAFNWNGPRFTLAQLERTPSYAHYFTPWPRSGDFGLVAENEDGVTMATTWWRFFPAETPGDGFVDETIP